MGVTEQRIEVLKRVERGELSPEEGAILLGALERGQELPSFETQPLDREVRVADMTEPEAPPATAEARLPEQGEVLPSNFLTEAQIRRRKLVWLIPFLLGLLITSLGGIWMVQGYQKAGLGWGFWLSWIPFLLGVGLMALSWNLRRGCWLHVRIHQKPGSKPQKIDLSFPLPIRLGGWFFRNFGDRIPSLKDKHIDEILDAIQTGITPETPMVVQVDEDNEQVEVWIECS
jgi:hypothetical protein